MPSKKQVNVKKKMKEKKKHIHDWEYLGAFNKGMYFEPLQKKYLCNGCGEVAWDLDKKK